MAGRPLQPIHDILPTRQLRFANHYTLHHVQLEPNAQRGTLADGRAYRCPLPSTPAEVRPASIHHRPRNAPGSAKTPRLAAPRLRALTTTARTRRLCAQLLRASGANRTPLVPSSTGPEGFRRSAATESGDAPHPRSTGFITTATTGSCVSRWRRAYVSREAVSSRTCSRWPATRSSSRCRTDRVCAIHQGVLLGLRSPDDQRRIARYQSWLMSPPTLTPLGIGHGLCLRQHLPHKEERWPLGCALRRFLHRNRAHE